MASASGYGAYSSLLDAAAVVTGVVVDRRGPRAVLNEFGAVNYADRSENAEEWSTPFGLPVLVLDDVVVIEEIGGSTAADAALAKLKSAAGSKRVEVLAPVGVYDTGANYQFWLQPWQDDGFMSYLAFDNEGPVAGLGIPQLEFELDRLAGVTGESAHASLVTLARELNRERNGGIRGDLTTKILGSGTSDSSADVPSATDTP